VKYSITTPSWLTASPASGSVTTSARTITFTVAQPWSRHLHRQYRLQQHDQWPREHHPRRDTDRQSEAIQAYGECFTPCLRQRQRRRHIRAGSGNLNRAISGVSA
jgi:hypothetical protein